jgi:hypothetical protein
MSAVPAAALPKVAAFLLSADPRYDVLLKEGVKIAHAVAHRAADAHVGGPWRATPQACGTEEGAAQPDVGCRVRLAKCCRAIESVRCLLCAVVWHARMLGAT